MNLMKILSLYKLESACPHVQSLKLVKVHIMNILWNFSTILLIFIVKIGARLVIVPDERFQPCDGSKEIGPGEKLELNGFVYDAEYILLDDLNVIVNGTYTFKTNVNAPWSVRVIGEKFERGKWTQRVVKNMYDACYDFFNPMDIFYTNFKTFQRCPYKKGVSVHFVSILIKI